MGATYDEAEANLPLRDAGQIIAEVRRMLAQGYVANCKLREAERVVAAARELVAGGYVVEARMAGQITLMPRPGPLRRLLAALDAHAAAIAALDIA